MTAAHPPFATTLGVNSREVQEDYSEQARTPAHPTGSENHADEMSMCITGTAEISTIKAYVVDSDEDSEISEIEALHVDILPTRVETAKKARSKLRLYTIFAIIFLILLATAIMVPVYMLVLKPDPLDRTEPPSMSPSLAPSEAPTDILYSQYVEKISEISNPTMLMTTGTAQNKAITWLYHHDPANRRDLDDARLFQRYIAAVFYYSTSKGRGWHDCYAGDVLCTSSSKKPWLSLWDECDWYGFVECDENRFVTRFIIQKNQNGVGNSLHGNGLHGTLPEEFGYLTSLEQLTIDRNLMLTSSIPTTFSKFTNLRKLSLLFNNLQEPWSEGLLDDMTELSELYLNYNDFNMTVPVDISNCTSLTELGLGGNKLHGSIPSEYGKLKNLTLLELNENYLTGNLPITLISSGNTSVLEILDLQNNRLNGTLPAELGNLHYINKLYLSNNDFQGGLPESLGNIGKKSEKYKTIGLDGNRLSGIIPPELANISNLYSLNLTSNLFTGEVPETICSLPDSQLKEVLVDCDEVECSCCNPSCEPIVERQL